MKSFVFVSVLALVALSACSSAPDEEPTTEDTAEAVTTCGGVSASCATAACCPGLFCRKASTCTGIHCLKSCYLTSY